MCYIPNDWKLSQNYVEPFTFVRSLILLELQPSKEVSFFSVQILGCGGYRLNHLDEPVFMAGPKPMLAEIGIHHRLESCIGHYMYYNRFWSRLKNVVRYLLRGMYTSAYIGPADHSIRILKMMYVPPTLLSSHRRSRKVKVRVACVHKIVLCHFISPKNHYT